MTEPITPQEAIRAARLLRDYCRMNETCKKCPFYEVYEERGEACTLNDCMFPEVWDIPEEEDA